MPADDRPRTLEDLEQEVRSRTWFHTIDLGNGIRSPGEKDTIAEVRHMRLPDDLTGLSVLDIGAYDGFYSFEAERRNAARVVAADKLAWDWPGSDAERNFDLAHEVLGSLVEKRSLSVEEVDPDTVGGRFDVVLFLGVLYHAPDPLGYLARVREVTKGFAIIETVVDLLDVAVPAVGYYAADSLNHDSSNHFGPNPAALSAMLHDVGFARVESFDPWESSKEWAIHAPGPTTLSAKVKRRLRGPRSGRMVFHAYC
jgi:tRNA (mo5U34)-methyltransferase